MTHLGWAGGIEEDEAGLLLQLELEGLDFIGEPENLYNTAGPIKSAGHFIVSEETFSRIDNISESVRFCFECLILAYQDEDRPVGV